MLLSKGTNGFFDDYVLQNVDYMRYVLKHKYNVADAGLQMGVSPYTLLKHDYSKFNPQAFDVYEDYFFGPNGIRNGQPNLKLKKEFRNYADWHYTQEEHHNHKLNKPQSLETELEVIADWYSVGKTNASLKDENFPDFPEWWKSKGRQFLATNKISLNAFNQINKELNVVI